MCTPLDHPLDSLVINTSRTVLSFFVHVRFLSYEHLLRIVQVYLSSVLCPVDLLPFLLYGRYLPEPVRQMTTSIVHSMSQCTLVCLPHSCGSFGGKLQSAWLLSSHSEPTLPSISHFSHLAGLLLIHKSPPSNTSALPTQRSLSS